MIDSLPSLPTRIHVTGLAVDPIDLAQLFDWVVAAAKEGRVSGARRTVGYLNVHVANTAAGDERVRRYVNECCDLVYCDGKGIGWGARLQGLAEPPRMTAADWFAELFVRLRDKGLSALVVAGKPGVAKRAVAAIAEQVGSLGDVTTHHGYLEGGVPESLTELIAERRPEVVLVGMGTPTQERWVLEHRAAIDAPLVWALGATCDYYAGEQARGPEWLRRVGHEWAARLLADPTRLWKRYVLGNPRFLLRAWLTR
ncbi:MAG: WecB/TagA/CpsF family glycosyltransferase [Lacipirellulaceae bacterium]